MAALGKELDGALAVPTDVTDPAQVRDLVAATLDRHQRIDGLVNNAGASLHGPLTQVDPVEARLAVDRALEQRQAGFAAGDARVEAGDLLGAFDRPQRGHGQAAAICGDGGTRVEQTDKGADVLGFPGPPEVPDQAGLPDGGL